MRFPTRRRIAVAMAAASLAPLVGAAGAVGTTPPPDDAPVKAGPAATTITSTIEVHAGADLPGLVDGLNGRLADLQGRFTAGMRQLNVAIDRSRADTDSKVRALRARVRSQRHQLVQAAQRFQEQAIAEARSSADGVWLVVNSSGAIVDQSGGIEVSRVGTGAYKVKFDSGSPSCTSLGSNAEVQLSGPKGPVDGGFFIAAKC